MEGWWAASYVVLWLLVVALSVVVVALARQIGTLHLRLDPRGALEIDDEGPALGEAVPPLQTTDINGREVVVGGPGKAQLLLFVSPGCRLCDQVLPSLRVIADQGRLTPLVIADSDPGETALHYGSRRPNLPVVASQEAAQAYGVPGTPYVVVLDDLGVATAKGTVNNLEQMEGLVETAHRRLAHQNGASESGESAAEPVVAGTGSHGSGVPTDEEGRR